jgi:toxic protein SymE
MDTVPVIRLQGRWLEHLGFKEGQVVEVEEAEEKITIRVREACLSEEKDR